MRLKISIMSLMITTFFLKSVDIWDFREIDSKIDTDSFDDCDCLAKRSNSSFKSIEITGDVSTKISLIVWMSSILSNKIASKTSPENSEILFSTSPFSYTCPPKIISESVRCILPGISTNLPFSSYVNIGSIVPEFSNSPLRYIFISDWFIWTATWFHLLSCNTDSDSISIHSAPLNTENTRFLSVSTKLLIPIENERSFDNAIIFCAEPSKKGFIHTDMVASSWNSDNW